MPEPGGDAPVTALDQALDVFRVGQYFRAAVRVGQVLTAVHQDGRFLIDVARAFAGVPRRAPHRDLPFPPRAPFRPRRVTGAPVGVVSTGGSGALASLVGVVRALEEADVPVAAYSLCSGSALFGFPLAAGLSAAQTARLMLSLTPADYVDVDWRGLATALPRAARGWAGLLSGDRLEQFYRRALGDLRLRDLPVPAFAPIWNIETNRVEYLGPSTYPDMTVARAIRMSVSLPLFFVPVELAGGNWCDGGTVDIFPVRPILELVPTPASVVAVNGFYPPDFAGEDATGWQDRVGSVFHIASQYRTCQQVQLARENLGRLAAATDVIMIDPVPYQVVAGAHFYQQFLTTRDWPVFMAAGRVAARRALRSAGAEDTAA